jgi:chromosome segregation ATPase
MNKQEINEAMDDLRIEHDMLEHQLGDIELDIEVLNGDWEKCSGDKQDIEQQLMKLSKQLEVD